MSDRKSALVDQVAECIGADADRLVAFLLSQPGHGLRLLHFTRVYYYPPEQVA